MNSLIKSCGGRLSRLLRALGLPRRGSPPGRCEETLESLVENVPGILFRCWLKPEGTISVSCFGEASSIVLDVNARGVEREGLSFPFNLHPDDVDSYMRALRRSAADLSPCQVEFRLLGPKREIRWFESRARPVRLKDATVQWDGVALEITDRKRTEAMRDELAYFDALTGLANLRLFLDRLGQAVFHAERTGEGGATLVVDINRFRWISDSWGATVSETILMETAARLTAVLGPTETVARIGDDQFAVLAPCIEREEIVNLADRLMQLFDAPFRLANRDLRVTASMGVSIFPKDGRDALTVLRNAQTALHEAQGENPRYRFYAPVLTERAVRRASLETELREGLEAGELCVFYQPQVTPDGDIAGAEALLRWQHRRRGLVLPDVFVPIAEQSDLIDALGEFALRSVCERQRAWRQRDVPAVPVSVNLSKVQMRDPALAGRIVEILRSTSTPPGHLELEVTESAILPRDSESVAATRAFMRTLREAGVRFAIDDFGVEYSALGHLAELPVDVLKIDRSFTSKITTDDRFAAVVRTIISIAHTLGCRASAEGVERVEQANRLKAYGCDLLQGYLYSQAVSGTEFERMLVRGRLMPAPG